MTENKLKAMLQLMDDLSQHNTHIEVLEYEDGKFDWDVVADSAMSRRDVIRHADRYLTSQYNLSPGWLYSTMEEFIASGHIKTINRISFMQDISAFLVEHDASITLTDNEDGYILEGLSEEGVTSFNQLISKISKDKDWFADWFILEAKRLHGTNSSTHPKGFRVDKQVQQAMYKSTALDFLSKVLKENSLTLYFWQEPNGMILYSTDDQDMDSLLAEELSKAEHFSDIEGELSVLWGAAFSGYDNIRFRVETEEMVAALINNRLLYLNSILFINDRTEEFYFFGKEDTVTYHAKISTFAALYGFDRVSIDFIKTIKTILTDNELCYSNIRLVGDEQFPSVLPIDFQSKCNHLAEKSKGGNITLLGGSDLESFFGAILNLADDKEALAMAQIVLSLVAERTEVSLSYLANKKLDELLNYNYVDTGDGHVTVIKDTMEVII